MMNMKYNKKPAVYWLVFYYIRSLIVPVCT